MYRQRYRRGVVILSIGMLGLLIVYAPVAGQQQSPDVKTPPEITIQPMPPGPMFADVNGYTLYVSERDVDAGKSSCTGACASEWIPLRAAADAKPLGDWTLVARNDGAPQWAYKGRALYRYAKETKPRWADGQNQLWRYALVSPFPPRNAFGQRGLGGPPVATPTAAAAASGAAAAQGAQGAAAFASMRGGQRRPAIVLPPGVPGGITGQPGAGGSVFADWKGSTLYTSTAAAPCSGQCLEAWKPLTAPLLAKQPVGDWSIVKRPDGTLQWAYKTKLVYRSIKDVKAGDTNGEASDWHALPVPSVAASAPAP
jgi:predicted lipoprotein with Yx(FWY)xxD motif